MATYVQGGQGRLFAAGVDRDFPSTSSVRCLVGGSWDPVGSPGVSGTVRSLGVFFDGIGASLYAAGDITAAGGQPANRIARWNGQVWSPVGQGLNISVNSLALFDPDAQGPLPLGIVAAGVPLNSAGLAASPIWYWNGSAWTPRAVGMNDSVYTLQPFDSFSLFAGGSFSSTGVVQASRAAYIDGAGFHAMANGNLGNAPSESVRCFEWFDDDGPGPNAAKLYVGGQFQRIGGLNASSLGVWNGTSWSALPSQFNGAVNALEVHDDGSGPALYAGGVFTAIDGVPVARIARWDGQSWSAVGQGFGTPVVDLEKSLRPPQGSRSSTPAAGFQCRPVDPGSRDGTVRRGCRRALHLRSTNTAR